MGIYIKNMDMPINGNEINITIQSDGTILDQFGPYFTVSAINIPPHGRLIDADALVSVIAILQDKTDNAVVWEQMRYIADDMQTVIPADRE